jgi:toxin secretion/phage lysis holin
MLAKLLFKKIDLLQDLPSFIDYKFKLATICTLGASFLVHILEKYVFSDVDFLISLGIVIAMDTVLGFWKHWKSKTVSSQGFSKFISKFVIYGFALVLTHTLTNFTINGVPNSLFGWIDTVIYSAIMVREAISIFENIGAINNNILPSFILKRLKQFDEKGNFMGNDTDSK